MKNAMQFSVGGDVVQVPNEDMDDFYAVAKQNNVTPEPIFSYRVSGKDMEPQEVEVPKSQYGEFAKVAADNGAKIEPLRRLVMDDGTERTMSMGELHKFMRSDEYRKSADGVAARAKAYAMHKQTSQMAEDQPGFWSELGRRLFTADGIRENAEESVLARPYAYANDIANALVGGLLKGSAKISEGFGHMVGSDAIVNAARSDQQMIDRNLPTDMLDTKGNGAINKVLQVGKTVAEVSGEFAPSALPGVGQAYAALLVGGGATARYANIYDEAIANGVTPQKADALAFGGAVIDAAGNMLLMGKFRGIWSGEQKALAEAAKRGLVRRVVGETVRTGGIMSGQGMAGDVIDQAAEGAQDIDWARTAKVGFDQFIEGGLFHLVNSGAHAAMHIDWGREAKGIPDGAARDMMEAPEGRALIFANSPDAARALFRARRNGEDITRKMIEDVGLPDSIARTVHERNAIADRLMADYDAFKERVRTKMDDVQAEALADEIGATLPDRYGDANFEKVWFNAIERIKDAKELDDPEIRQQIVAKAFEDVYGETVDEHRAKAVEEYNRVRAEEFSADKPSEEPAKPVIEAKIDPDGPDFPAKPGEKTPVAVEKPLQEAKTGASLPQDEAAGVGTTEETSGAPNAQRAVLARPTDGATAIQPEPVAIERHPGSSRARRNSNLIRAIRDMKGQSFNVGGDGEKIGIDAGNEYFMSKYTKFLRAVGHDADEAKSNWAKDTLFAKISASRHLKEIIESARNERFTPYEQMKDVPGHEKTDARYARRWGGGKYEYDVNFTVPNANGEKKTYSARLVVRANKDGRRYLYDIVDLDDGSEIAKTYKRNLDTKIADVHTDIPKNPRNDRTSAVGSVANGTPAVNGTTTQLSGQIGEANDAAYVKWLHGLTDTPKRREEYATKMQTLIRSTSAQKRGGQQVADITIPKEVQNNGNANAQVRAGNGQRKAPQENLPGFDTVDSPDARSPLDEAGSVLIGNQRNNITMKPGRVASEDIVKLFHHMNRDPVAKEMAEKVFRVCDEIGLDILIDKDAPSHIYGWSGGDIIGLNPAWFSNRRIDAQEKANTILHEHIHAVTGYAIDIVEGRIPELRGIELSKELRDAVSDLNEVYLNVAGILKKNPRTDYAPKYELSREAEDEIGDNQADLTNARHFARLKEFIAELANPDVRKVLKKQKLWTRTVDSVRRVFNSICAWINDKIPKFGTLPGDRHEDVLKITNDLLDRFLNGVDVSAADRAAEGMNEYARRTAAAREMASHKSGKPTPNPIDIDKTLTFSERWKKRFKDSNVALQSVDKQLGYADKRGEIADEDRSIWMARMLQPGRVQAGLDRREMYEKDIGKLMKTYDIDIRDIDDYLLSFAAPERNARLTKKGITDGSGMTDADAAKLMSDLRSRLTTMQFDAVRRAADLAWKMQAEGQKLRIASGRVKQSTYDGWQADEPHHVPMRDDYSDVDGEWTRSSGGYKKREFAEAEGRGERSDSPLVFMFREFSEAVTGSEDNAVRAKIADAVRQNPSLGKVHSATKGQYGFVLLNGAPGLGVQLRVVKEHRYRGDGGDPNILLFKENGELRAIELNGKVGEQIATAMTRRDVVDINDIVTNRKLADFIKAGSRAWANTATAWSPTFGVGNFAKDKIENDIHGIADYGVLGGVSAAFRGFKNIPKEAKPIFDYIGTRKFDTSTEMGRLVKRFVEAGGEIGGGSANEGYSEIERNFEGFANQSDKNRVVKIAKGAYELLKRYNETMELLNRVNNFKNATDHGMSDRAAALKSRLDSTDFNQFGDMKWMNTVWNFSNSVTGGTLRQAQKLLGKNGWKIAGTLFAWGMAEGFSEVLMNGDDEKRGAEGEPTGKDMTEYERANSAYVRVGGKVYRTPIHAGWYSAIKYAGNGLARVLSGELSAEDYAKALYGEARDTAKHYTATGDVAGGEEDQILPKAMHLPNIGQSLAPSVLQPLVQVWQNKTYRGTQLKPTTFSRTKPEAYNGRKTTPDIYKAIAQFGNDLFGGNKNRKSVGDMSPEVLRALFEGVTKNLGKDIANTADVVAKVVSGKEVEANNVPFKNRFVRDVPENDHRYYDALHAYEADLQEFKDTDDIARKRELVAKTPSLNSKELKELAKKIQFLKNWEDGRKRTTSLGEDGQYHKSRKLQDVEVSDEKIRELQAMRHKLQAKFLRIVNGEPPEQPAASAK